MSKKNLDKQGRLRSKIVSFRMSPEEAMLLDAYVSISGLTKQDYLIHRALQKDIIVYGNPRVFKGLRNRLDDVLNELNRINNSFDISNELINLIKQIVIILDSMKGEWKNGIKKNVFVTGYRLR